MSNSFSVPAVSSKTRIFRTYLTESYTRGDRNEQPIVITDRCLPKAGFESDHHFSTSYSQFTSIQSTLHVPRVANFNNTTTACAESSPAQTRSFSQPTEFDVDLILTQKSFSPSPIRHSKTKSLDSGASKSFHANFNHLNKGILNARLPSTSSLASSTTTASRKKKVKFTPATLLLDLLQHGPETDPHPQPAIQRLLDPVTGVADLQTLQTPQQSLSLLHLACANGRVEVVRTLLRRGDVPVNTRDREGWTPLHCACAEGHMDVVSLLGRVCSWVEDDERCEQFDSQDREVFWVVDGPVELEAKNGDGETPEMVALDERKEDVRMIFKGEYLSRHTLFDILTKPELRMLRTKGNEIASNPDCANKSDQEASVCGPDVQNLLHIPIVAQLSPPLTPQISNLCEHKDVLMVSCSVATPTKSMICLQLEQPAKLDQITPPVTCIHAKATPLSDLQQPSSPHQQPCVKDQPPFSVLSSPKISPIPFLQTLQSTEAEDTSYALEEAPKSPKPLRGSAAKLIAAFNQISSTTAGAKSSFFRGVSLSTSNLCSPSRFGSGRGSRFGSISTFEVTRPHVEAAKELSTLNKLSLVTSWDTVGNASVPTVAPLAQANSVSSSSPVLSATGRRRSLLVHQRRDSSEVGGVAVVSTASDNTLHKREDVAKKKKAHRLSETTSGFFSWMDGGGVVNKQSHSNLSLKTLNTS
ncbi:hypothetical protein BC830DRAFT_242173 [Chytriomyces sp. MP71]|nr:hypothetical protein BC830DRAFT_242173 [Chytriomyces sp. MP71]